MVWQLQMSIEKITEPGMDLGKLTNYLTCTSMHYIIINMQLLSGGPIASEQEYCSYYDYQTI